MPLTLVVGSQLATMALCATLKSVTNHYNYPEWLGGVCRRDSRNGWQGSFPDEGCGSLCCISLFAEAGRRERVTFRQALMTVMGSWYRIRCLQLILARFRFKILLNL